MPAHRDKRYGRWRYKKVMRLPDGSKKRIGGTPTKNTKQAAEEEEQRHVEREICKFYEHKLSPSSQPKEVPTFQDQLRADLIERALSDKRINNILAVLSKALRYAASVRLIQTVPPIGLLKVERPEIEPWDFAQYARMIAASVKEGPEWHVATCLAGEAGLRIGEVKALRWREDVDLIAETITVNQQTYNGITGTPKGRTRRTIPMTGKLSRILRSLSVIREGYVARNLDGSPLRDGQSSHAIYRICRRAGLPEKAWHTLRHSFGTHAAQFGVNPWRLMQWMGHKRIDETMR